MPCARRRSASSRRKIGSLGLVVARGPETIEATAHELSTLDDGREVPRVPVDPRVRRVEVQERSRPIAGRRLGVHLDHLGVQSAASEPHRSSDDAADPVAADDHARAQGPLARAQRRGLAVVVHAVDAHAVPEFDPARPGGLGERVIELDAADHAPDGAGTRGRFARAPHERHAVDGRTRDVDRDPDRRQESVAARAQCAGAGLLARVPRLLEHDDARAQLRGGVRQRERRRRARGAAPDDDDVARGAAHAGSHAALIPGRAPPSLPVPRAWAEAPRRAPGTSLRWAPTSCRAPSRAR